MSMPKPHALCRLFPRPTPDQKGEIKADVKKNGLLKPIICWRDEKGDEWMIDGLTRNTIIDELISEGIDKADNGTDLAKTVEWFEGDKAAVFDLVIATNFHRREMSKSQRAGLVVAFADLEKKYKGKESGDYATMVAKNTGVNRQYIFDCKTIKEKDPDSPKLLHRVIAGELKVKEALKLVTEGPQKPKPAPAEQEDQPVLDGLKNPVPEPLKKIFQTRDLYKEAVSLLRKADQIIKALRDTPGGKTIPKEIDAEFTGLVKSVKAVIPHVPCPHCEASGIDQESAKEGGKKRCGMCKGHKYIDKIQHGVSQREDGGEQEK